MIQKFDYFLVYVYRAGILAGIISIQIEIWLIFLHLWEWKISSATLVKICSHSILSKSSFNDQWSELRKW